MLCGCRSAFCESNSQFCKSEIAYFDRRPSSRKCNYPFCRSGSPFCNIHRPSCICNQVFCKCNSLSRDRNRLFCSCHRPSCKPESAFCAQKCRFRAQIPAIYCQKKPFGGDCSTLGSDNWCYDCRGKRLDTDIPPESDSNRSKQKCLPLQDPLSSLQAFNPFAMHVHSQNMRINCLRLKDMLLHQNLHLSWCQWLLSGHPSP